MRKLALFILGSSLMTGCSILNPYSEEFACPGYRPGVCASIEDVYKAYKQGKFTGSSQESFNYYYAPKTCTKKVVCKECGEVCGKSRKCCKEITVCKPDSVSNHVDYRAQAVKDNEYDGEVVWQ
jgi:hypothetical protein